MPRHVLIATAFLTFAASAVQAQTSLQSLDFSYRFNDGDIVSGVLDGTLAADGNHFTVSSIASFTFDGVAASMGGSNPYLSSSPNTTFKLGKGYNGNGTAVVTIDGSYLDIFSYAKSAKGFNYFLAFVNDDALAEEHGAFGQVQDRQGAEFSAYKISDWRATLNSVPEPASLSILGLGLSALVFARRRSTPSDL